MSFRKEKLTKPIYDWAKGVLPSISETEEKAIGAGTVWWDGELFSGSPDWDKLLAMPPAKLTAEESTVATARIYACDRLGRMAWSKRRRETVSCSVAVCR